MAVTDDQALIVAPDGSLWAWGGTDSHMIAVFGKPTVTNRPVQIGSDRDWRQVAASDLHVYAIKTNGSLWGWGWIGDGIRTRSASEQITAPRQIGTTTHWREVRAGVAHALALASDGSLWAWDRNNYGQVGDGTKSDHDQPVRIGEARWIAITAGSFNSFGLREDRTVWGWGSDLTAERKGDILRPKALDLDPHWTALSSGAFHLLGLKHDGTLWIMGQSVELMIPKARPATFYQIGADRDWSEIHAGPACYLARKVDGSWWGYWPTPRGVVSTNAPWMPTRLPFDLRPWALGVGKTSVYLDTNAVVWSWGPRLGYLYPSQVTDPVERAKNRVKAALPDSIQTFLSPHFPVDQAPFRLWQLPTRHGK